MGIAIGAALSLMYATGIEAQAAEVTPEGNTYDPESGTIEETAPVYYRGWRMGVANIGSPVGIRKK